MQTMQLRRIQQPSQIETLLDTFAADQNWVPEDARPVLAPRELPAPLQRLVVRSRQSGLTWRAWTDDRYFWFLTGEMSLELSRERGRPVLSVSAYDEEGLIEKSGAWVRTAAGGWQQCGG